MKKHSTPLGTPLNLKSEIGTTSDAKIDPNISGKGFTASVVSLNQEFQRKDFTASVENLNLEVQKLILNGLPRMNDWPIFRGEGEYNQMEFIDWIVSPGTSYVVVFE